jgi:Domain of Unknown Function (DUF1206)
MPDRAPAWVVPVMRAGYAARGIVYVLVGALAILAAWHGGQAEGAKGALSTLTGKSWGSALLWIVALGLFCYAAWRLIAAWMDLERHGAEAKGIVARLGLVATGVIHAALGVYVVQLAATGTGSGGGNSEQRWTAWLMSQPSGRWIVVAIGAAVIGAGIYYGWKGISEKYKEHLRWTPTVERLDWLCKLGFVSYGLVIAIVGCFLLWAGWTHDASEAGGLEQAFSTVHAAAYGRVLLGVLGIGVLGFAIENFIEAAYRVVPAREGGDVATLAARARQAGARAGAKARSSF